MSWFAILKHAPAVLSAAEALLLRAKTSRADDQTRSVDLRLEALAESSRASAELIEDMAKQLEALVMIHKATAQRLRTAIGLSAAAFVLAVAAVVIAFVR